MRPPRRTQKIRAETRAFHERIYGRDFEYADFAPQFRAEMFDADKWAEDLQGIGREIRGAGVQASRWIRALAFDAKRPRAWGRPWNAVEVGPKRDLVGELTAAVRRRQLEMGFYFSLYEWFNPLWLAGDADAYVERHLFPQFKDLVTRYSPSVIFSDGEWELPSQNWRAPELLAWLFNESPVAAKVVVNDRWGSETRHAMAATTPPSTARGCPARATRGRRIAVIGHSYGFNRNEDLADYATGQRLLLTLSIR